MNFNRLIIGGRMTRDAETRFAPSGVAVCKFGVAVNRKDKEREETLFLDVTMLGKRAEAFARFHTKGAQVFLEGRLVLDKWTDKKTGEARSKLYMLADSFEFVGGKRDEGASAENVARDFGGAVEQTGGDAFDNTPF